MKSLKNQNILVIGGSSGIGAALVRELSAQKANVYAVSRSANEIYEELDVQHLELDVTAEDISKLGDFLPEELHGLAYCPGSINLKPFARLSLKDFQQDMNINLFGAVQSIQTALPRLKKSKNASIVMFSTVASRTGMNFHASVAAAKSAVEGFAISLAAELAANGIRVNVIAPSITDTPMAQSLLNSEQKREAAIKRHPLKKVGKPEELAAAAAFLLSPTAGWITGQVIGIDGGLSTLKPL